MKRMHYRMMHEPHFESTGSELVGDGSGESTFPDSVDGEATAAFSGVVSDAVGVSASASFKKMDGAFSGDVDMPTSNGNGGGAILVGG